VGVLSAGTLRANAATSRSTTELQLYNPKADQWTTTTAAPSENSGVSLICTDTDIIPVPSAGAATLSDLPRYDTTLQQWSVMSPVSPPGLTPCATTSTYGSCDIPRWTGHGHFVDVWLVGKDGSGMRYDTTTNRWTPIATGPDLQPIGPPGDMAWVGALAATFATENGPGSGAGHKLLVYRPGP
jgi:hypothetical protein